MAKNTVIDLFAASAPIIAAKSASNKEKVTVALNDLEMLASIKVVIQSISSLAEEIESNVKFQVRDHFVKELIETERRPESFIGLEGDIEASCTLARKASSYDLGDETIALLEANKISYENKYEVEERFVFNPEALKDEKIAKALNEMIQKHPDLKDKNIVVRQPAIIKRVPTDNTILDIGKIKDVELATMLLKVVTNVSVGKFQGLDTQTALQNLIKSPAFKDIKKALKASQG